MIQPESTPLYAVILAAGKGTRMQSDLPKVLHPLSGVPMIHHVLRNLSELPLAASVVVVGHEKQMVIDSVNSWRLTSGLEQPVVFATQEPQKGTGHAVLCAESAIRELNPQLDGWLLVTLGDVPLLKAETVEAAWDAARTADARATVLTMTLDDPTGYGRILRDSRGAIRAIREQKDASAEERAIQEVNTGIFLLQIQGLFDLLRRLNTTNAQGEYYLTDIVQLLCEDGQRVMAHHDRDCIQFSGVNSPEQLRELEKILGAAS